MNSGTLIKNFFMLMIIFAAEVFAQQKTLIEGRVCDRDGKPLPLVNVFIQNSPDGTMSDDNGTFSFHTSKTGSVKLIASMIGYRKYVKELDLNENIRINLTITLAENAVMMKEAVVSASSYGSDKEKGLVVSRVDILTTPGGAADIYQALKTMPGLTQVSESAELYVRGGDPIETITIIDQAPVYHPFTFESSYGGIFSNLNTSDVKSLFFSSGGFSAKYGNALSGVLEVETKNLPKQTHFNFGLSLANASLTADLPIVENKFGLYFDVRQEFTKPIFWLNGGLDRMSDAPNSQNASGGMVYSYSGKGRLKLFTILADDRQGVKVERAEFNGVFNGTSRNAFFDLQNSYIISDNLLMKNSLSYNNYNNKWLLGVLDLNTTDGIYSLRSDFEYVPLSYLKILSGFEFENRVINYKGTVPAENYDIRPDAPATFLDAKIMGRRIGVYSEIQSTKIPGLHDAIISAGVRYDMVPELDLGWIDPRVSAAYELNGKSSLRFSWGIYHQLPDPKLFRPEDGNPDLKPMEAVHNIISYDYSFDKQNSFRVEAYYKNYLDLPLEDPITNYNSSGHGYAYGADFIYKGIFPFGITGWISYGYINTKRIWMDYDKFTNSSFDITNNLTVIAKYNLNENLQLGLNIKYATGRPYTPVVSAEYSDQLKIYQPVYALTNSGRFPDYKRVDLRITYFGQLGTIYSLIIYMEGLNIFNFNNIFGYTYSPDYSQRSIIKSYFGQRMLVLGFAVGR